MFDWLCDTFLGVVDLFSNLNTLDMILVIILLVSLIAKAIGEIICWLICRHFNTDKTYSKKCIHLNIENEHDCELLACKKKYFKNQYCEKEKCPGYRVSKFTVDQIKEIYKFPFLLLTITKWTSELSTVILIIRTLLNNA